jgi:hypothetical protein
VKGPQSFIALKTVADEITGTVTIYSTYNEAAVARKLFASDAIYEEMLDEAMDHLKSMNERIRYFANVLVHCQPKSPLPLLEKHLDQIFPPTIHNPVDGKFNKEKNREVRKMEVLRRLEYFLNLHSTSCQYVIIIYIVYFYFLVHLD